jgi:hypothetical protein
MIDRLARFRGSISVAAITCCMVWPGGEVLAYESDVHYGLTMWLALKAGFTTHEAEAIARGNQRVDSGGPQAIDMVLDYGCALPDPAAAQRVQRAHAPSATSVPAPPAQRRVLPGSEASREQMNRVLQGAKGKEAVMLSLFGAALHVHQDSWSHAGVPSAPDIGAALTCKPELAVSHPLDRGGATSHDADLTYVHPDEAVRMAQASYQALTAFPSIDGRKRLAAPWGELDRQVRLFAGARTKTQKKAWFNAHGIPEVNFLGGVTLPDGDERNFVRSTGSLLPELKSNGSNQHDALQDVRQFFDTVIAAWLSNADVDKSMPEFLSPQPAASATQLQARLKLLKLQDHGTAAGLVHKKGMLSASDLRKVSVLTRDVSAYVQPASVADALLPLVTRGANVSPLLPYIARDFPGSGNASPRAIAMMRLKHAPYDSVGLIAERTPSGWKLLDVVAAVDH